MVVLFQRSGTFINKIVIRTFATGNPEYGMNGMAIEFADGSDPIIVFGHRYDAYSDPYFNRDYFGTMRATLNAPNGFDELRIGKNTFPNTKTPIKNMAIYLNGILVDEFNSLSPDCCGDTRDVNGVLIRPQTYTQTFKLNSIANGIIGLENISPVDYILTNNPIIEILAEGSPINGGLSAWTDWGECLIDVDGALKKTRSRLCNNPTPANGGANCVGSLIDTELCPDPINGGVSEWSDWSECLMDVDGVLKKTRSRLCDNPTPAYGGAECVDSLIDTELCPEPINGGLSNWTDWSECIDIDGVSKKNRSRLCNNPIPANGGANCVGNLIDSENCLVIPIVSTASSSLDSPAVYTASSSLDFPAVYTVYSSSVAPIVSTVSSSLDSPTVSSSLDSATVYTVSSSNGGSTASSNVTPDLSQPHDNLINGVLGDWGNWGECVKDTGGNYKRSRTKTCTNPDNVNGTAYCGATAIEEESCSNSTSDNSILLLLFIVLIFVAVVAGGYALYRALSNKKIGEDLDQSLSYGRFGY